MKYEEGTVARSHNPFGDDEIIVLRGFTTGDSPEESSYEVERYDETGDRKGEIDVRAERIHTMLDSNRWMDMGTLDECPMIRDSIRSSSSRHDFSL